MVKNRRGVVSRLGASAMNVGELFGIIREMSFDDLRDEAMLPPRLLLIGADRSALVPLRDQLGGPEGASFIEVASFEAVPHSLDTYDGIALVNASPSDRAQPEIKRLLTNVETSGRVLTFQLPPTTGRHDTALRAVSTEAVDDLRRRFVTRLSHRQLALGRYLPAFRQEAATNVINATARANAEFAFLSNIPAVIPIVGNIVAAGADFLVLTKNQLMLIYKLAAIHGRDIQQPWRLYTEMLPVAGAGLVWRTAARELASLLPFAAGTLPKMLIAYAGTAVTGQAAHFFYQQGKRPTNAQLKAFYQRAGEFAKTLPFPFPGQEHQRAIEGQFKEHQAPPEQSRTPTPNTSTTPTPPRSLHTPPRLPQPDDAPASRELP